MATRFRVNEHVRVVGQPKGSIDEFARIEKIYPRGKYWIVNGNQPFQGTISAIVTRDKIAKVK